MIGTAIALLYASLFMFAVSGLLVLSAIRYRKEILAFQRGLLEVVKEKQMKSGRRL